MVTPIGPLGTGASDNADPAIARLLSSLAFRRSRRAAEKICLDPEAVQALVDQVRGSPHANGHVNDTVARAEPLLRRVERVAAEPQTYDRMTPSEQARHRLLVAAVHYLVTPQDIIPDEQPAGTLDDLLVLTGVVNAVRDAESRHS